MSMMVDFKAICNVALLNLALKSNIEVFATAVAGNKAHQWKLSLFVFGQELTLNLNCISQSLAPSVSRELFMSRPLLFSWNAAGSPRPSSGSGANAGWWYRDEWRATGEQLLHPARLADKEAVSEGFGICWARLFYKFCSVGNVGGRGSCYNYLFLFWEGGWPSVVFLIGFQLGLNIPPQSHQTWRISSQNRPVCDTVSFFVCLKLNWDAV